MMGLNAETSPAHIDRIWPPFVASTAHHLLTFHSLPPAVKYAHSAPVDSNCIHLRVFEPFGVERDMAVWSALDFAKALELLGRDVL